MLEGRRKSVEPMAARLGGEVHYQALHHLVAVSPWDWRPVRRRLAERLVGVLDSVAWAVDDTGFPKDGCCSVGCSASSGATVGWRRSRTRPKLSVCEHYRDNRDAHQGRHCGYGRGQPPVGERLSCLERHCRAAVACRRSDHHL
jgi:hypothetical protein